MDTLAISGTAVIIFCLWSILKTVFPIVFFLTSSESALDPESPVDLLLIFILVMLAILLAADLLMRLFVGLSARSDGRGKKKRIIYLIFAFILLAYSVFGSVTSFMYFGRFDDSLFSAILSTVVDLTSVFANVVLIIYSIKVRKLRKQLAM